jgi:hypothetical protein
VPVRADYSAAGNVCVKVRAMAQKASHRLIRKVRRDRQEGQDYPDQCLYLPVELSSICPAHTSPVHAERSYQRQSRPSAARISAFAVGNTEMVGVLTRTDHHSCNIPFSNIAIQSQRSFMAIVAKQEEFCCGPRQGN